MFQIEVTVKAGDATGTKLEMAINKWNAKEFYNLYCNIKEQWFIYNALNHEWVLPAGGTIIIESCGGCSSTFLCRSCVLFHPVLRTDPFLLLPFQVEFLIPNLYPNAVLAGLPNLTRNSVPRLQPSHFPSDVMIFVQQNSNKFGSRFFLCCYSNSRLKCRKYLCSRSCFKYCA